MNGLESSSAVASATHRLREVFGATHPDESEIRNVVCSFVDVAKPLGWPVERIIVEVKRVAEQEDGFLHAARLRRDASQRDAERLLERTVTWCIQHYFWTPSRF